MVRKHLSSELASRASTRHQILADRLRRPEIRNTRDRHLRQPSRRTRRHGAASARWSKPRGFVEIHVATPLDVCEGRDRRVLRQARAGNAQGIQGISDPYEEPSIRRCASTRGPVTRSRGASHPGQARELGTSVSPRPLRPEWNVSSMNPSSIQILLANSQQLHRRARVGRRAGCAAARLGRGSHARTCRCITCASRRARRRKS